MKGHVHHVLNTREGNEFQESDTKAENILCLAGSDSDNCILNHMLQSNRLGKNTSGLTPYNQGLTTQHDLF